MCVKPITIRNKYRSPQYDKHLITIKCGKCNKCINDERKNWAFRLHWEATNHSTSYFLTLTYDELNLPYINLETGEYPVRLKHNTHILSETDRIEKIVYKKDVQNFIKTIRKAQKKITNKKIRYYACSEYGTENTKRAHYHIILFSLEPEIQNDLLLGKHWTKGNIDIKPLDNNPATYYYVTKYLFKQRLVKNMWTFKPFSLMSTKPYIGHSYLEKNKKRHIQNQDLFTTFNNKEIIIPRIYHKHLPKYLKDNTYKKLAEKLKDQEKQQFISTHKKNWHPDILNAIKKIKKEEKFKKETTLYKNQILRQ